MPIPRRIHQIWIGGRPMPPAYEKNMARLREHNTGWAHELWGDAEVAEACERAGIAAALSAARCLHHRIDLARYAILALHGGVSVDLDVVSIRPLDELRLEGEALWVSECSFNPTLYEWERRLLGIKCLLNNAFFAAPARCPPMRSLLEHCARLVLRPPLVTAARWIDVILTTGPLAVSRHLGARADVRVLHHDLVEPGMSVQRRATLPSDTVLWHLGTMSWMPGAGTGAIFFCYSYRYTLLTVAVLCVCAVVRARRRALRSRHVAKP